MLKKKFNFKLPKVVGFKSRKVIPFLIALLLIFTPLTLFNAYYSGKIYPNVYIAGIHVSGLTPTQAEEKLDQKVILPTDININMLGQSSKIPIEALSVSYDFSASSQKAYFFYRSGNIFLDLYERVIALTKKVNLPLETDFDEVSFNTSLSTITQEVVSDPVYPSLAYVSSAILVEKGLAGQEADTNLARKEVLKRLAYLDSSPIDLKVIVIDPTLTVEETEAFRVRGEALLGKSLSLKIEDKDLSYKEAEMFKLLDPSGGYKKKALEELTDSMATKLDRSPENPVFIFEEGRVREFGPAKTGISVDQMLLSQRISEGLNILESSQEISLSLEIPANITQPEIQTGDINNLGIRKLLGRGTSTFRGSIPNRVHNISLASSRFKGVLIPPGETFSFNASLGDISAYTGYKQAFVIKDGKTVLGDGGGVCQVSSTFFRAALNSGLPIIERRAHSYRVSYYEQNSSPGYDATVYSPSPDLKILNDTPGHILIQPAFDAETSTLVFDFYGTSDGRKVTLTKPIVSGVSPPPEDLYVDDPTLPTGQIKQIEHKAWGARATFDYRVERNGEILFEKTFVSSYRPWQAVFLRGVGPMP